MKLQEIIKNLQSKDEVDAALLTGSQGKDHKPYSDIDLIVILKENSKNLRSLYTWIDDKFADIFFFDHKDIEKIATAQELPANAMDAVLVNWLEKATLQFDKSGLITKLKSRAKDLKIHVPQIEIEKYIDKVNYNLIANTRYFESNDPLYHEALEMRLLYSTSDAFTAYFEFRDIPWRGEKNAFKYLKENDSVFYQTFLEYTKATTLQARFEIYKKLSQLALPTNFKKWKKGDILPQPKDRSNINLPELEKYWIDLITS